MFSVLLHSIHNPKILVHATLLKKQIIIKLILFLSMIFSLPTIINNHDIGVKITRDFQEIVRTISTKNEDTPYAITGETTYLLYDKPNTVNSSIISDLSQNNLITIIAQQETATVYFLGRLVFNSNFSTTQDIVTIIDTLQETVVPVALLSILVLVILNMTTVIAQTFIILFVVYIYFLMQQKIIKPKHLFRVSLFACAGPYIILAVLKTFQLTVPFELFWVTLYAIYVHKTVITYHFDQNN